MAGELTAVDQYLAHGERYADLGLVQLAEKAIHESDHERQHARAMIQRLLMLGGRPDLATREPMDQAETVEEMIQADLDLEYRVAEHLKAAIQRCEALQDYVTRDMLVIQLKDTEEDHAYYLEIQLRLIQQLGLQNYLQLQARPGHRQEAGA